MGLATKTTTIDGTYRVTYLDQEDSVVFYIYEGKAHTCKIMVDWAPVPAGQAQRIRRVIKALDKLFVWGNTLDMVATLETAV